jgi:protein-S-isoprenylcysteine O-methyltransferase Ste14
MLGREMIQSAPSQSAAPASDPAINPPSEERLAFGGPLGALAMMTLLPLLTLYLWACVHLRGGALAMPSGELLARLPMPTAASVFWLAAWFAFQLALDIFLPGRDYTGLVQKDGLRRTYRLNGLLSLVITLGVVGALLAMGTVHGMAVVALLGPLLVTSILFAYLFSVFLYVYGRREGDGTAAAPATRIDKIIYDYFMGTGLNPRIGRIDLKMFMESKIGMTTWLVLAIMMAHAEYEQTGALSLPMALVCLFQVVYTFDFFWFEEAMLSTWDINNENYGFMLAFAFLVWMPFNFSLQSQYLLYADPQLPVWGVVGIVLLNFAGYYIFRSSNLQKHRVKTVPGVKIWGREPEFIQTQRGTRLLASGWWGMARHSNYLGDLMMALAWCLATGFGHVVPYFYFIYFAPLLIDRERRDDQHCAQKYGSDWDRYRERVPYRIVPFIY